MLTGFSSKDLSTHNKESTLFTRETIRILATLKTKESKSTMGDVVKNIINSIAKIGEILGLANIDQDAGLIFITGGTGPVGHRVATRLLNAGYPQVRIGAHHATDMEDKNKEGAEIADFGWDRPDTYEHALAGVKTVFCTTPYHKDWKKNFGPFLEACKKAGIQHFVKFSFYHARMSRDPFHNVPLVKAHGDCDEKLIKSGLTFTILGASHLMSNPLVFQGNELRAKQKPAILYGASANKLVNYVSPNDVAECAVRVILEPHSHHNQEYNLTGSIGIAEQEMCQLLSDHLKKPIMYVDQPLHTFQEGERMSGNPNWIVEDIAMLEMVKASGYEADPAFPTMDIKEICGHEPETYAMYLRSTETMSKIEKA
jgi:NAD(P)H dehydrogenase (quinone)